MTVQTHDLTNREIRTAVLFWVFSGEGVGPEWKNNYLMKKI